MPQDLGSIPSTVSTKQGRVPPLLRCQMKRMTEACDMVTCLASTEWEAADLKIAMPGIQCDAACNYVSESQTVKVKTQHPYNKYFTSMGKFRTLAGMGNYRVLHEDWKKITDCVKLPRILGKWQISLNTVSCPRNSWQLEKISSHLNHFIWILKGISQRLASLRNI